MLEKDIFFPLLVSAPTRYTVQISLMLKHTEKKQAFLSEKQFVSNLKIRGIILSLVKTPTMGQRWGDTNDGEKPVQEAFRDICLSIKTGFNFKS